VQPTEGITLTDKKLTCDVDTNNPNVPMGIDVAGKTYEFLTCDPANKFWKDSQDKELTNETKDVLPMVCKPYCKTTELAALNTQLDAATKTKVTVTCKEPFEKLFHYGNEVQKS
ncbi:hypothetical protein PMAYCL1PPCAC_04376, partial [Pristionchus mayeri]